MTQLNSGWAISTSLGTPLPQRRPGKNPTLPKVSRSPEWPPSQGAWKFESQALEVLSGSPWGRGTYPETPRGLYGEDILRSRAEGEGSRTDREEAGRGGEQEQA